MLIIQRLTTEWTKVSRKGEMAKRRNSTPLAIELPSFIAKESTCFIHDVSFGESNNYLPLPRTEEASFENSISIDPVKIFRRELNYEVSFVWSWHSCGAPERRSHELFVLNKGEWASFLCNGRLGSTLSSGQEWTYKKTVLNIAFLDEPKLNIFTNSTPKTVKESLVNLR